MIYNEEFSTLNCLAGGCVWLVEWFWQASIIDHINRKAWESFEELKAFVGCQSAGIGISLAEVLASELCDLPLTSLSVDWLFLRWWHDSIGWICDMNERVFFLCFWVSLKRLICIITHYCVQTCIMYFQLNVRNTISWPKHLIYFAPVRIRGGASVLDFFLVIVPFLRFTTYEFIWISHLTNYLRIHLGTLIDRWTP